MNRSVVAEARETILSLRMPLPHLPVVAALSANDLAALKLPNLLQRLYIARDNDLAGDRAAVTLGERAQAAGVEALNPIAARGDFNDDLRADGLAALRRQICAEDTRRFGRRGSRPQPAAAVGRDVP